MKGQYIAIEYMFLFMIGVILLVTVYISLTFIQNEVKSKAVEDQAEEICKLTYSEINKVHLTPGVRIKRIFTIPKKIAGKSYRIYVVNKELVVEVGGKKVNVSLDQAYNISGSTFSSAGNVKIEKINGKMFIGREI